MNDVTTESSGSSATHAGELEMSVIIPVHNEAPIIEGSIRELCARLERFSKSFEVIIAENGSKDETAEIAAMLAREMPHVRLIQTGEPNYGKALRAGIMAARGKYIHCDEIDICDADFHRRARELFFGEDGGYDMVVGSKTMHGARDGRPMSRRMATKMINGILRVSLGFRGTDTHGLKAFRRESIVPVVEQCIVDRDMFSSELVIRSERAAKRIVEIPLNLKEKRLPSIALTKRVPRVLKNVAQLVYIIRLRGS
jgi:glycosyltransferase involved in cell wall biosynthesis